jgi:hypothetical protein
LVLVTALAAFVGCSGADQPPEPPDASPTPVVLDLSPGQVGVSLGILQDWSGSGTGVSEIALALGDEFTVVVNADTNGEVVTVGQVELDWDASALAALEFSHGDLIGSAPMGGYALTGPQGVLQGSLRYTVFDQNLPDETPPGVLARFKFRVVDGRFGEPRAEDGAFPIRLIRATLTDDTTGSDLASLMSLPPMSELPGFEGSGIEAVLRGGVVVRVGGP